MFDMTSMLLGAAVAGIGISITMLSMWLTDRKSYYKAGWAVGVGFLILHVFAYWIYARDGSVVAGTVACALQPIGAAYLYASVRQYFDAKFSLLRTVLWVSLPYLLIAPPIFAAGYDGVALVIQNMLTATLLILGGVIYVERWRESPFAIGTLALLYTVTGVSFALCGLVIATNGQWTIGYPPQNWAEELNTAISILALTGAGAMTLSLDQMRLARRNQLSAMSDPLSGLLNRRGLAAAVSDTLSENEAVVMFDLDHFKRINDLHGHAVGDGVIQSFADTLREHGRSSDPMARLGGEEFAMVMRGVSMQEARGIAERILVAFAAVQMVSSKGEQFSCTVSAGIAFGQSSGVPIEHVMARADSALYSAKRAGRNRIESGELRLVG
ncbi:MAG: GGDEF domain-containing protein [Mesorhizobium sp.]|nr:GGDEF domain-containing protein [Mesorhizobium sp.]MBL8578602.1 GGDEF domain-containing protein [Mesorhizobium sp.]